MSEIFANVNIYEISTYFFAMIFALTGHEAAHALISTWRGDHTAKNAGRLTLNPLAHADPVGTFLLPLLGSFLNLPIIGWARPVPVNLRYLKNPRWDHVLIAAAGPAANLLMAILCLLALAVYARFLSVMIPSQHLLYPVVDLVKAMVWVNTFLAFFNLIPLPPLDGAAVAGALLPHKWSIAFDDFVRPYGYILLFMLIISGGLHWIPKFSGHYVEFFQTLIAHFV